MAAEEAFTNIAMHAYTDGGDVEAIVHAFPGQLTLTLVDEGAPFDPRASSPPDLEATPEDRPVGRLGVHLILNLADEVRYRREDGMNILTIVARVEGVNRSGIEKEER